MAKNKDDLNSQLEIVEEKPEKVKQNNEQKKEPIKENVADHKYTIESFLEENIKSKSNSSIKSSFKVWYVIIKKLSLMTKRTMSEWENLLNEFLHRSIQN